MSLAERFWSKVNKTESCWVWTACKTKLGYGQFGISNVVYYAHRVAYELVRGRIPDGMVIDHLCRNPSCVNPAHLDVVTQSENIKRGVAHSNYSKTMRAKTHCKNGHEFNERNTYFKPNGNRNCKTCQKSRDKNSRLRRLNFAGDL